MEEIRRVAVACGLPSFRYHSFSVVTFVPAQATKSNATPIDIIEQASIEYAVAPVLQRPEVVLSEIKGLATPLQTLTLPVTPIYSLLAEVVDAVAGSQGVAARAEPKTTVGNSAQPLSRPTRRRPRPAGRAALAAVSPT